MHRRGGPSLTKEGPGQGGRPGQGPGQRWRDNSICCGRCVSEAGGGREAGFLRLSFCEKPHALYRRAGPFAGKSPGGGVIFNGGRCYPH